MNPYKVLGIKDATQAKKAYRKLSKKYHPDRPGGDVKKFEKIAKAYDMIKNGEGEHNPFAYQKDDRIFDAFYKRPNKKHHDIKIDLNLIINESNLKLKISGKEIKAKLTREIKDKSATKIGDYIIRWRIKTPDNFSVRERDIFYHYEIDYLEAMVGKKVQVPALLKGEKDEIVNLPVNCPDNHKIQTSLTGLAGGGYYVIISVTPPQKDYSEVIKNEFNL